MSNESEKEYQFGIFMNIKYREVEEYARGVSSAEYDIAEDAWNTAWDSALKTDSKLRLKSQGIQCYSSESI